MNAYHSHHFDLLTKLLTQLLGSIDAALLETINREVEWVFLKGNETLFHQGDTSNSVCFVLSGRLLAIANDANGNRQLLGDIVRGETVGELPMFTGEPRSADVIAARDSTLAQLSKRAFTKLISQDAAFAMNITRLIIQRFNNKAFQKEQRPPVCIGILSAHPSINGHNFAQELKTQLEAYGSATIVSSASIAEKFEHAEHDQNTDDQPGLSNEVTRWLDDVEANHDFLLYVADPEFTAWTSRCVRQSDQVVVLADATLEPHATSIEKEALSSESVKSSLVLMHPADTFMPSGTCHWLDERPWLDAHFHLRLGHANDLRRFSRIVSGNATGLVLAGGGAKGFAHIGVFQALCEHGIPIDYVGGTSVGATVAAAIAMDMPDQTRAILKKAAAQNPTKDLALIPFVSLMTGKRAHNMVAGAIRDFTGDETTMMEDLWIPMFAISSNFTQAKEEIHRRGSLKKNLLASIAIPGVFPPVISGNDLLIDGATFNNFPVDVMRATGVKTIIGCDLVVEKKYQLKITETPSTKQFISDKLKPKKKRKYRLPSMTSILINATVLYSYSKRKQNLKFIDLLFNPDLTRFGMTNWKAYDKIVDTGYQHALEVLEQMPLERKTKLQSRSSRSTIAHEAHLETFK
jgi:NTE family protein